MATDIENTFTELPFFATLYTDSRFHLIKGIFQLCLVNTYALHNSNEITVKLLFAFI